MKTTDGPDISLRITAVDLLAENGAWQNHYAQTVTVRSGRIGEGQQFLARMALPPDRYTRIRLKLGEVQLNHDGGQEPLSPKNEEIVLELRDRLHIAEGDSRSLFLTWDTKSSLQEGMFAPDLLIAFRLQKLIADVEVLRRDYEKLRAVYELQRAIGLELDLDKLLAKILDRAFEMLPADRGAHIVATRGMRRLPKVWHAGSSGPT